MRMRLGLLGLLAAGGLQAQAPVETLPPAAVPPTTTTYTTNEAVVEGRTWLDGEYVLGFIRRQSVPPLIRTGPAAVLNQPDLQAGSSIPVLYPQDGRRVDYNGLNGLRLRAGTWLDEGRTYGVEAGFLGFEQRTDSATFFSVAPGRNFLTRYYFNPDSSRNIYVFGDNANGPVAMRGTAKIDPVWTAEINGVVQGYAVLADRVDWLVGFRYYDQRESLQVDAAQAFNGGGGFSFSDRFASSNQFYGLNLGWKSKFYPVDRWSAEITGKLAFGETSQRVNIGGNTLIDIPGQPLVSQPFGLLARPTNVGQYHRDFFTVLPELNLRLNYSLTSRAKFSIGYDLLYISSVTRPGQAIDPVVQDTNLVLLAPADRTQSNAVTRPSFSFRSTDMWVQGITFGLSVDY